jgi:hypothetical protein
MHPTYKDEECLENIKQLTSACLILALETLPNNPNHTGEKCSERFLNDSISPHPHTSMRIAYDIGLIIRVYVLRNDTQCPRHKELGDLFLFGLQDRTRT